jgi:putative SbcD/Mre11-related phosphoesterase
MHLELIKDEPALLLQEKSRRILVVADLHIGYQRILLERDQYSVNLADRIIQRLEQLIANVKPSEVIILGDLKHSVRDFSQQEFHKVALLLHHIQQKASLTIVRGNHDADIELVAPDNTQIIPASGFKLTFDFQQVYLIHGHAQPTQDLLDCGSLLMAHIHPVIAISSLKQRSTTHRVWVKTKWKPTIIDAVKKWWGKPTVNSKEANIEQLLKMKILILPAFLDLLRGHVLNSFAAGSRLGTPLFRHLAMNNAEIIMLDHTPLGRLEQLQPKR